MLIRYMNLRLKNFIFLSFQNNLIIIAGRNIKGTKKLFTKIRILQKSERFRSNNKAVDIQL